MVRSTSLNATRSRSSNPPTSQKTSGRIIRQAAVRAQQLRTRLPMLKYPRELVFTATPPTPTVIPSCWTRPSGKLSFAPTAPTRCCWAWPIMACSQSGLTMVMSQLRKSRRSQSICSAAMFIIRAYENWCGKSITGPGWASIHFRVAGSELSLLTTSTSVSGHEVPWVMPATHSDMSSYLSRVGMMIPTLGCPSIA